MDEAFGRRLHVPSCHCVNLLLTPIPAQQLRNHVNTSGDGQSLEQRAKTREDIILRALTFTLTTDVNTVLTNLANR
jgi:hypothetical protein